MKRFIATIMLSIILFLSVFNSYSNTMTVQATEIVMPVIDGLLSLFGVEMGLGNQKNFFSAASEIKDFASAVANGRTVNIPLYGDVNFSDSSELLKFLTWAQKTHSNISNPTLVDVAVDSSLLAFVKVLDKTSYKNSGTSATNAMSECVDKVVGDYNGSSEALAEDVQDTFKVVTGGNAGNNKNNMTPNRWDLFTAIASTFLLGASKQFNEYVDKLDTPEDSSYTEYDDSFVDADGFSGVYETDSSGRYVYRAFMSDPSTGWSTLVDDVSSRKVFGILSKGSTYDSVYFYGYPGGDVLKLHYRTFDSAGKTLYDNYTNSITNLDLSCNFPIYSSKSEALEAYNNNDYSSALNICDTSAYLSFKSKVGTATEIISVPLGNILDTEPSPDHLRDIALHVLEKSDPSVGTDDYVPKVKEAFEEEAGTEPSPDPDEKPETSTTFINYTNILLRILNAILSLPSSIWELFMHPWESIYNIYNLLSLMLNYLKDIKEALFDFGDPKNPFGTIDGSGGDSSGSTGGATNFLNGFLLLIYILFMLLRIFLHLLEFIINVFKIPADPGFITGDFATGFNYIKSVQLSPLSISIYDFLMGLVHILVIFSVVKSLKHHIDKIHI